MSYLISCLLEILSTNVADNQLSLLPFTIELIFGLVNSYHGLRVLHSWSRQKCLDPNNRYGQNLLNANPSIDNNEIKTRNDGIGKLWPNYDSQSFFPFLLIFRSIFFFKTDFSINFGIQNAGKYWFIHTYLQYAFWIAYHDSHDDEVVVFHRWFTFISIWKKFYVLLPYSHAKFVVISRVSSYTNKIHDISEWRWNKDDEVHVTADWSGPLIYFSHLLTFHHHIRTLSKAHLKALSIIFLSFLYYCAVAIWWIHV